VRQFTAQSVSDPTTVRIFTGADGDFTLYDDDGQSLGYQDGSDSTTVWIQFHWDDSARRLTAEPDQRMKRWPGGVRAFKVEIAGSNATPKPMEFRGRSVTVNL
jgi:Domain of unknown function (DUF5110)